MSASTERSADAATGSAVVALGAGPDGRPALGPHGARRLLIGIAQDAEALRITDPGPAAVWRTALRDVLSPLMANGGRVTGFTREGRYVVETAAPRPRTDSAPDARPEDPR